MAVKDPSMHVEIMRFSVDEQEKAEVKEISLPFSFSCFAQSLTIAIAIGT